MGIGAYNRGSALIRRQIEESFNTPERRNAAIAEHFAMRTQEEKARAESLAARLVRALNCVARLRAYREAEQIARCEEQERHTAEVAALRTELAASRKDWEFCSALVRRHCSPVDVQRMRDDRAYARFSGDFRALHPAEFVIEGDEVYKPA